LGGWGGGVGGRPPPPQPQIPNPQSPIPNPQDNYFLYYLKYLFILIQLRKIENEFNIYLILCKNF